ncbi:MAG: hypothetical protein WA988_04740, partial [Candidatus Nanopelagicales bacterium]
MATETRRGTRKAVELAPGYSPIRANKIIPSAANYRGQFRPISPSAEIADAYDRAVGNALSTAAESVIAPTRAAASVLDPPRSDAPVRPASIDLDDDSESITPLAVSLTPVDDEIGSDTTEPDAAVDVKEGRARRWRLPAIAGAKPSSSEVDRPTVYDANGVEIGDFDINRIDTTPTDGNYRRGRRMLAIVLTSLLVVSSITLVLGILLGRSGIPAQGAVSPEEAVAFRLSKFPVDAA